MDISQPEFSTSSPKKCRRGAPAGNTNALKHGYYAKVFPASHGGNLEQFDFSNLEEEIMLVRLALRQVAAFNTEVKTYQEAATMLRLVCLGVATLNRLLKTRALVKTAPSRFKNYYEFSRWFETMLAEENPRDPALEEEEAIPFPKEDPVPVPKSASPSTPTASSTKPQLLSFDEEEEDDIPPALDPDGRPIDFEANLNNPAITPAWHIPGAVIPTTPGRAKKTKPTKPTTPERSARWYAPPDARGRELNRIDISPKTKSPCPSPSPQPSSGPRSVCRVFVGATHPGWENADGWKRRVAQHPRSRAEGVAHPCWENGEFGYNRRSRPPELGICQCPGSSTPIPHWKPDEI